MRKSVYGRWLAGIFALVLALSAADCRRAQTTDVRADDSLQKVLDADKDYKMRGT